MGKNAPFDLNYLQTQDKQAVGGICSPTKRQETEIQDGNFKYYVQFGCNQPIKQLKQKFKDMLPSKEFSEFFNNCINDR